MVNQLLVNLVNKAFKHSGKSTARNNKAYRCPSCHHSKSKLEVNFDQSSPNFQSWACWVCGIKGKSFNKLFKLIDTPPELYKELTKYVKDVRKVKYKPKETDLKLPEEFISLKEITKTSIIAKHAVKYLTSRGITKYDIIKYNLGYCKSGIYSKRIIIPSYNDTGGLNFFVSRTFDPNVSYKYKNPSASKDVIVFENLINWNLPIILCEGMFDALAIRRNVIPLLGKTISRELMKKISSSKVQDIYIALDKDAQREALKHCERLMDEGKNVHLINLEDKDPSDMGFENFITLLQKTFPLTYSQLLEKKLSL